MKSLISALAILIAIGGGLYLASVFLNNKDELKGITMNISEKKLIYPGEEGYEVSTQQGAQEPQQQLSQQPQQPQQPQEFGDELRAEIVKEGTGQIVKEGDTVSVHYVGVLEDGTKFDSSIDRGQPFQFTLGAGQVIQGWDLGVVGMKIGEVRRLYIPSAYGYGEQGAGASIPPNSNLIFEVELLGIE